MEPIVLIKSLGIIPSRKLIQGILGVLKQPEICQKLDGENAYSSHKCSLKTKYYENSVCLVPVEGSLRDVPTNLLRDSEILIVYFDATNTLLLEVLPDILKISEQYGLDGIFVTSTFPEKGSRISYEQLKKQSNFNFDIICLVDEAADPNQGYEDIVEAFKNHVWSNVNLPTQTVPPNGSEDESLESELEAFDDLLATVQNLRLDSAHLTRAELLDKAEEFAMKLAKFVDENKPRDDMEKSDGNSVTNLSNES